MPHYNIHFEHSIDTGEDGSAYLSVGDAFRWEGTVWRVDRVEGDRVVMAAWPSGVDYPPVIKGTSA